jgi:hypothetical protein
MATLTKKAKIRRFVWAAPGLIAFGLYLGICGGVTIRSGHWPVLFTPPQFDWIGLITGAVGEPFGRYIGGALAALVGAACCGLGIAGLRRR